MAELDDSLAHLRSFIATLQAAKAKVDETTTALDEQAGDLARLEATAGEGIGDFVEALETFASALQEAETAATGQLDRVADEGRRTAGERLDEVSRTLADDESAFDNTVQVGRDDLDKDAAGLTTNGFQLVISSVETIQGEVDAAQQGAESSFQTFDGAVQDLQQDAEAGFDAGAQAFDAAVAGFGDQGTQVATQAADSESELQARARELEAECGTIGDGATASYASHGEAIAGAAEELIDAVHTLGEDNAAFVVTSSADQIDAPVGMVMADGMPPLIDQLEQLDGMLADSDQTTTDTDALCGELARCQRVVETIDEMLNAME